MTRFGRLDKKAMCHVPSLKEWVAVEGTKVMYYLCNPSARSGGGGRPKCLKGTEVVGDKVTSHQHH